MKKMRRFRKIAKRELAAAAELPQKQMTPAGAEVIRDANFAPEVRAR